MASEGFHLGVDLGTSSVKTVLIDHEQRVLDSASAPLTVSRPNLGWSEQDPEDWWRAMCATIDALCARRPAEMGAVVGIGLSGQQHGATLLDAADEPIRPCLLWNDVRATAECAALEARAEFRRITANPLMPGFTAPKVEWVRTHEPDAFARIAKVLLPKDFLRHRLIGDYVSDMSDSSGAAWLDVGARAWSATLLAASGLSEAQMPRLVEGSEPSGQLRTDLAERWKMRTRPIVAGGGGDNAAAACGMGIVAPGSAFVSIGTSGVLFIANAALSPNPDRAVHAFCHALPDTWHQMGVILSAADSLTWLGKTLNRAPAELTATLSASPRRSIEAMFLPYLSGERTPVNDGAARGLFVGLSQSTTPEELTQAVLEGVAFAFRDSLDALRAGGATVESAFAIGGGANSEVWVQTIADALRLPLHVPAKGDFGAAFGAARLGLIAATGAAPARICTPPAVDRTVEPDPAFADALDAAHARYRRLYPAFKEVMTS